MPGTYAQTDELIAIAKVAARHGGLDATDMRNEGERLFEAFDEAIQIGRRAEIPVQISHHKAAGKPNHGKVRETLKRLEDERAHGLDITVDQYPYTAGSTTLVSVLPPGAQVGGVPKILEGLRDPATRREIRTAMAADPQHGENMIRGCSWGEILIASVKSARNKACEGKSLQQIAEMRGEEPLESVFNLLLDEECAVAMIMFTMAEDDVRTVMQHPATMIGTDGIWSHGKPHPRIYGPYPRILGTYVREQHLLSLEEAIRKMTLFPAQKFGLGKKGIVREGMDADLVIFNPDTIAERSSFQAPPSIPDRPAVCSATRLGGGRSGAVYREARGLSREEAGVTSSVAGHPQQPWRRHAPWGVWLLPQTTKEEAYHESAGEIPADGNAA